MPKLANLSISWRQLEQANDTKLAKTGGYWQNWRLFRPKEKDQKH